MSEQPATTPISLMFDDIDQFIREQRAIAEKNKENVKPTKKQLKALRALEVMNPNTVVIENEALEELGEDNWIGKLNEYRQANPVADEGMIWNDNSQAGSKYGPRFTSTLKIPESDEVFASRNFGFSSQVASFSNKKNARKYAAMLAVKWLIQNNYMPGNGDIRFPRAFAPPPSLIEDISDLPYATQVPHICKRLGFNNPRYVIAQAVAGVPLYSAYADFGPDPRIEGKIGEVKDVFGRKAAKEQAAKLVVQFLEDIERQRSGGQSFQGASQTGLVEEADEESPAPEEDRKPKRSSIDGSEFTKIIKF